MTFAGNLDWQKLLVPEQPVLDVIFRGTLVYLFLFVIFRICLKRRAGGLGLADILVVVLIADAAQNAMGSDYKSISEGAALILTIVFWDYVLDWTSHRVSWLRKLTRPPPLLLIQDGQLMRQNMQREMITKEELLSLLRQQGFDTPADVKKAFLEGDGNMSVISRQSEERKRNKKTDPIR
jgi:uncharacterized membrane protein YcaP (DUF421 family)